MSRQYVIFIGGENTRVPKSQGSQGVLIFGVTYGVYCNTSKNISTPSPSPRMFLGLENEDFLADAQMVLKS